MAVINPFVVGGYVSPRYFCDRVAETENLIRNLINGRNVALVSTRRMGKTGLIRHCFYQPLIKEGYYTFFIDIYATSSLKEFVFALGKGIFEKLKPQGNKFIDRFFSIITSLRIGFKLDSITGEPILELGLGDIHAPETTLEEIFIYLEQADKPCIVAIDEFQQISSYPEKNLEAILRTKVQHCSNSNFVFAGSQRHIMMNIFNSPSRPFYQSVSMMHLGAIPLEVYKPFVKGLFEENGKKVTDQLVENVYTLFDGHTWYVQLMLNELFILTKEIMIAIAKEQKAKGVTSAAFIKKYRLTSASSVQSGLKGLLEKDMLTQESGGYQVYDRLFNIWLRRNY